MAIRFFLSYRHDDTDELVRELGAPSWFIASCGQCTRREGGRLLDEQLGSGSAVRADGQFLEHLENRCDRDSIRLVRAAVDEPDYAAIVNDQRRRTRDMNRVVSQAVIDPVGLGYSAIFIQQKGKRNRMLGQKLCGFEHAVQFLGCDVN